MPEGKIWTDEKLEAQKHSITFLVASRSAAMFIPGLLEQIDLLRAKVGELQNMAISDINCPKCGKRAHWLVCAETGAEAFCRDCHWSTLDATEAETEQPPQEDLGQRTHNEGKHEGI